MSECGVVLVRGSEGVIVVDVVKSKIPLEVKKDEVLSGCGVVLVGESESVVIVGLGKSKILLEVKADKELSGCGVILVCKGVIDVPIITMVKKLQLLYHARYSYHISNCI